MANDMQSQFNFTAETQSTFESNLNSNLPKNLKMVSQANHGRNSSYDSHKTGGSPSRKSIAMYEKADMNDFTKGISELKVAYVPAFGH